MDRDFWTASLGDNRVSGLISELWDAISDCDDPDRLNRLHRRLALGLVNHAKQREAFLRALPPKGKHQKTSRRRYG